MKPFGVKATIVATVVATLLSYRAAIRKKSLTKGGAVAAFAVGFLSLWAAGLRGFNLLVFYQIGTMATKYKKEIKLQIDGTLANSKNASGNVQARGPGQVLACSLIAVILGIIHGYECGEERPIDFVNERLASSLTCGMLAHHATCLADTLASELGILSKSRPVLVTQPWRTVPTGTNGGITRMGCFWSVLGGFLIGLSTILFDWMAGNLSISAVLPILTFTSTCGLVGSLIDSVLGATLQQTFYDPDTKRVYQEDDKQKPASAKCLIGMNVLTNEQVNLASVAVTTGLGGWILGPMIFS